MSVALYIILGLVFFLCLSIDNKFLRVVNRTLATTLLTFTAMTIAMHAVYGGFDVGRKKNKPVISALIAGVAVTDLVTYLQLEIMNVNENFNDHLILFGADFLLLLLCMVATSVVSAASPVLCMWALVTSVENCCCVADFLERCNQLFGVGAVVAVLNVHCVLLVICLHIDNTLGVCQLLSNLVGAILAVHFGCQNNFRNLFVLFCCLLFLCECVAHSKQQCQY